MSQGGSNKKVSNSLLALSSAAILAVYTAGYSRTRSAADRFAVQTEGRRPVAQLARASTPVASPAAAGPERIAPQGQERDVPTPPAVAASPQPTKPATVEVTTTPAPVETPAAVAPVAETPVVIAEQKAEPKVEPPPPAPVAPVVVPPPPPPAPPNPVWKDGTYTGWGTSRHGDIEASVVIEGGRIASAKIAQCLTRYSCDVIDKLPPQVAVRQSPDVDTVGGATQSADAFYYAVVGALAKAK